MSMSMSKIFYKVQRHLLKQNERAEWGGTCQYRTDSGLSCAVGCLLTDEMYDPKMEGNNIFQKTVADALTPILGVRWIQVGKKMDLLRRLQKIHDGCDPDYWPEMLLELKEEYNIA